MKIESFKDFLDIVDSYGKAGLMYRGVSKSSHPLISSLGRYQKRSTERGFNLLKKEEDSLRIFESEYQQYNPKTVNNIWEILTLAQHHGLPTRLIDWSFSPLVALFFAVEKCYKEDAAIYVIDNNKDWIDERKVENFSPLKITKPSIFLPKQVTKRLKSQQGLFTIQSDLTKEFEIDGLKKYIIAKNCIEDIKWKLFVYGISTKSLFPDIDGLCLQIKWSHFEGFK